MGIVHLTFNSQKMWYTAICRIYFLRKERENSPLNKKPFFVLSDAAYRICIQRFGPENFVTSPSSLNAVIAHGTLTLIAFLKIICDTLSVELRYVRTISVLIERRSTKIMLLKHLWQCNLITFFSFFRIWVILQTHRRVWISILSWRALCMYIRGLETSFQLM